MAVAEIQPAIPQPYYAAGRPPVHSFDPTPQTFEVPDESLMEALQAGEPEALDLLYRRHGRLAFALALRITGDESAAEDVVQDAFLAVWRHAASYRPERGAVKTWLAGIVHHRAIDRLRGRTPTAALEAVEQLPPGRQLPDVADQALRNVSGERVRRALGALPAEQREVIALAYFGGWTQVEIARRAGVPVGTVKGRMRLGLEKLRRQLAATA
jgi:RNA polymerase sigma-70 factor (ECF subfamily)